MKLSAANQYNPNKPSSKAPKKKASISGTARSQQKPKEKIF